MSKWRNKELCLSVALPARSRSFDVRGNVTVNEMLFDASIVTSRQTVPYATNKPLSLSRYGVSLMDVSVSAVTNTVAYDSLGRAIAHTDGRGNTTHTEYNTFGLRSASVDALGYRTSYAYDQFGNLASVTDALGNATVYEYDLRNRKTYEGGATYPVRYTYDIFGNKTTMTTFRTGGPQFIAAEGDTTSWLYDVASGSMTNKVYADGKGPSYTYTPDGKLSQRTWARGIVTDYAYDNWGSLTNTVYSDNTPTISLSFDALGRQTEARDAAGVTAFLYDSCGSLTNETVTAVDGTNTIIRHWDNYGRSLGYSLEGRAVPSAPQRQTTLSYDPATGRLATMLANGSDTPFVWDYLAGSDLKSSLVYPNGLTASWTYDVNNQLLQVCNATPTNIISQYDYVYDAAGRRVSCAKSGTAFTQDDTVAYGYNEKNELTNVVAAVDSDYRYAYDFDDIGNRETSSECGTNVVYAANSLNQYTVIDNFTPRYDGDGNQTLIKTATGIWSVTYNGENRPVRWVNGDSVITMRYDRIGRRVEKNSQKFVYEGYLQIANFELVNTNSQFATQNSQLFIWDPTEPIATRPLVWFSGMSVAYYTLDGNKNVSEVIATDCTLVAHYDYSPFGVVSAQCGTFAAANPLRFACEYADDDMAMVYYNYRHYEPIAGRWLSRDDVDEIGLYLFCRNNVVASLDLLGKRSYSYEINLEQTPAGFSFYARVSVGESDCPKETEVEVLLGIEWQPPQLRAANRVLNLFRVHAEVGFRGLVGGKAMISECAGKSTAKICGRLEAFGRIEYRDWKVHEMGRRHRFTRSRFGAGADGGGTLCVDLSTGEVTGTMSLNWYVYANFGWKWFNRTYDFGGSLESREKLWGTFRSLKVLPPIKESDEYGCCCEMKYGRRQ